MQIELDSRAEELLKMVLDSGYFHSFDEIIADAAQRVLDQQRCPVISGMPEHVTVDELAKEQGVGPISDFRKLKVNFAPTNETSDDFLSSIFDQRQLDDDRAVQ